MNNLTTIKGVKCYTENGTAYLSLEDVARGLGFTRIATSGNEVVRWERVDGYLQELGVPTCGHEGYIPENIFYRLAMKAKNETAERFQAIVADEILPSIRKHGAYMTPDTIDKVISDPDFGIKLLTTLKEERARRVEAEQKAQIMAPKAQGYDYLMNAEGTVTIGEAAKILDIEGFGPQKIFKLLLIEGIIFKRDNSYLPYQQFKHYFVVKQNPIQRGDFVKERSQLYLTMHGLDLLAKLLVSRGYELGYTQQKELIKA